jgi:hypothetical protein
MIATFTKLLEINIVASNLLGESRRLMMLACLFESDEFSVSFSLGFKEKKATSEPEINPEKNNRSNNIANETIVSTAIGLIKSANNMELNMGPGSSKVKLIKMVNHQLHQ